MTQLKDLITTTTEGVTKAMLFKSLKPVPPKESHNSIVEGKNINGFDSIIKILNKIKTIKAITKEGEEERNLNDLQDVIYYIESKYSEYASKAVDFCNSQNIRSIDDLILFMQTNKPLISPVIENKLIKLKEFIKGWF